MSPIISGGSTGTVTSLAAADTSIVVGGTPTVAPTVRTNTLDVIAADHPPAADWSNNSKKITSLKDPTGAQDAATKLYVDNVAAGINPAVAVQAATTAAGDTSGFTYFNGVGGIGATLTGPNNVDLIVDGFTFNALGQRLLVKNDTQGTSGAFNGVYYVTTLKGALQGVVLTRALDYDQPSDINNTGSIPVVNGTANALTSWLLTSSVATVGTDPLTYAKFVYAPSVYTAYTPTWTATAGTAPAIGNAVVDARYAQTGNTGHCYGSITFGSTSTFGTSGSYLFVLPATARFSGSNTTVGHGFVYHSGNEYPVTVILHDNATISLVLGATYGGTITGIGVGTPWSWASGDIISWNITYEAA